MRKLILGVTALCFCSAGFAAAPLQTADIDRSENAVAPQSTVGASLQSVNDAAAAAQAVNLEGKGGGAPGGSIELGGPPSFDNCLTPLVVTCNSVTDVDVSNCTTAGNDPILTCHLGGAQQGFNTAWLQFQATFTTARVATCNSPALDSVVAVWSGACGALTLVGCNDDVAGCGSNGFRSILNVAGLTVSQNYLIEVSDWDGSTAGVYTVELSCPSSTGACCNQAGTSCSQQAPADCFAMGGIYHGDNVLCAEITCVGPIPCTNGPNGQPGILEQEANCGLPEDNFNSGCNAPSGAAFPEFFGFGDGCGFAVCGTASANNAVRDTDWYLVRPNEDTLYTITARAQFNVQVLGLIAAAGFDPCPATIIAINTGLAGTDVVLSFCTSATREYIIHITTVSALDANMDGNLDALRDGIACSTYRFTIVCDECPTGGCCFDNNGTTMCTVTTSANCQLVLNGTYLGDGSDCMGADCDGACCLPNGTCIETNVTNCINQGGVFQGVEVSCIDAECIECTVDEAAEPNCGVPDTFNVGCNATPALFSDVLCDDVICATTQFDGGTRDLDWYHWDIPSTASGRTHTTVLLENLTGRNMINIFRRYNPASPNFPCGTVGSGTDFTTLYGIGAIVPGVRPFFHTVRSANPITEYTLILAYDFNDPQGVPLACAPYRALLICDDTCDIVCDPMAASENEADCGVPTQANLGCSATPTGPFTALLPNQKMCGTVRLVLTGPSNATRDLDWYRITLPSDGNLEVSVRSEFFALVGVQPLSGPGGCSDPSLGFFVVAPCQEDDMGASVPVTIDFGDVPAGDYGILVAADFGSIAVFDQIPAGGGPGTGVEILCNGPYGTYELSTTYTPGGPPCGECGDSNCDGVVTPGDIAAFVAAVTGGQAGWTNWHITNLGSPPSCDYLCANDADNNGLVTPGDIAPFVARLTQAVSCN